MGMYIVVAGNPVSGFHHIGPFQSLPEAAEWANENMDQTLEYWLVTLVPAEEF